MNRRVLSTPRAASALAVLIAAAIGLASACGNDDSATNTPSPSASPTATASPSTSPSPSPTPFVIDGGPITHGDAVTALAMQADADHYQSPVGAYGNMIIVQTMPAKGPDSETVGWSYSLWDPAQNTFTPAWTDAPGLQETFMQSDGDWVETVTRGFGGTAGMDEWTLTLRNLKTGEVRTIAQAQPGLADINITQVTLQNNPDPSLAGGKLVWSEVHTVAGDGIQSSIMMYDIATAVTTTVEIKTDHAYQDLWSASTGGGKVSWLERDETDFRMIIHDLATAKRITLGADASFSQAKLTPDGRYLAVEKRDEGGSYAKFLINVATGEKQSIVAGRQGPGLFTTPRYISWDNSVIWDTPTVVAGTAPAGLYDIQTHVLRSIDSTPVVQTNVAHQMGRWFVWQELPLPTGAADAIYYFMELPD
ncbi:MAG: hypothetical protein ABI559_06645 [Chloroflexota bacterium]